MDIEELLNKKNISVETVNENDKLNSAINKMNDKHIGALVVLHENNDIAGIISERDLLKVCTQCTPDKKVRELMTPADKLITLTLEDSVETAFVPQPFVLQIETKSKVPKTVLDPQKELLHPRGGDKAFPFTTFVLSPKIIQERPEAAIAITKVLGQSIKWTLDNPQEAAVFIEQSGIMSAEIAEKAIPVSGIEFIPAVDAKASVEDFLQMLLTLNPVSLGGMLPDEGFYFGK